MGMGMVADAPLAESFGSGAMGYGLMIACWGLGSTLGAGVGPVDALRGPSRVWLVVGAAGIAVTAARGGLRAVFLLVLGVAPGDGHRATDSRSWPRTA